VNVIFVIGSGLSPPKNPKQTTLSEFSGKRHPYRFSFWPASPHSFPCGFFFGRRLVLFRVNLSSLPKNPKHMVFKNLSFSAGRCFTYFLGYTFVATPLGSGVGFTFFFQRPQRPLLRVPVFFSFLDFDETFFQFFSFFFQISTV